jgi:hypothetical protein
MKIFSAISVKFSLSLFSIDFLFLDEIREKSRALCGKFYKCFSHLFFEIKLSIY